MFLINYMETLAFAFLGYDAHQGRAKHVSTQTVVALTLSLAPRLKAFVEAFRCCFWRFREDS